MRTVVLVHAPRRGPGRSELLEGLAPCESAALRTALGLAREGTTVTAITVGLPREDDVLRAAVALGADRAIRVWDPNVDLDNPSSVGALLAAALREVGFDLVLAGERSSGWGSSAVGPAVAHYLDVPHLTGALAIHGDEQLLLVEQRRSAESLTLAARPPVVITVLDGPRRHRGPVGFPAAIEVLRPEDGSHRDAVPPLLRGTPTPSTSPQAELLPDFSALLARLQQVRNR
ncbi:MAG: hypothetical protein IT371_18110 [Deltaproteobacteria bacterium]|nr:hypothetical protein [Deltaproteobacteria bacterium]